MSDKDNNSKIINIPFLPVVVFPPDDPNRQLLKISIAISITMILAFISSLSYLVFFSPTEEGAFFKESELGGMAAIYNFVFYLIMVVIFSIILYIMIKFRILNILAILQSTLLGFISGLSAGLYIPLWVLIAMIFFDNLGLIPPISDSVIILFFTALEIISFIFFFILQSLALLTDKLGRFRNPTLILTSSWVGALLGLTLGKWTPIIFMLGFAAYDIFAVFKGPLKKISDELKHILEEEREESDRSELSLILGLGDLFFYSLAVSYSYAYLGFIPMLLVLLVILIGSICTVMISIRDEEKKALPALPIPMFLSLIIVGIFLFL